jgi:YtxH-like protein
VRGESHALKNNYKTFAYSHKKATFVSQLNYSINFMSKTQSTLFALVAGLAAGAVIGILLAPDKGDKTREKIAKKTADLKKELDEQVEIGKAKIYEFADSVVNKQAAEKLNA